MVNLKRNRHGWTLVEVMIVVAITGIIASMAPSIMNQITKFFILNKTKLELQQQARAAMYIITRELRQAQSSTIVIDRASGQFHYSRLRFTKQGGQTHTYYQNGANLMMVVGGNNTTTTISRNLAYLAFTFPRSDDMTIVSVSMTLQQQIYGGQYKALHMASERVRVMN